MDKRKTALLLRVGGMGDIIILTPIARELHKRGFDVDMFIGSPSGDMVEMLKLPYLRNVKKITRVNGIDCIEDGEKTYISIDILKSRYDEVFDYKYSVEENRAGFNRQDGWRATINSNYINWIDLSFAWANIDYTKLTQKDKAPEIYIPEKYIEWAKTTVVGDKSNRDYRVIGLQLKASSLIRTWYKADELPARLNDKYPNDIILIFGDNVWHVLTKFGRKRIDFPEEMNPLLCSAALVSQMNCFVSADSGMGHISEILGTETITIYTTVPAWTRMKYYFHTHPIEADVECHPCFTLHTFCPLEQKKADDSLSDREKEILMAQKTGVSIFDMAKRFNTVPKAIQQEFGAAITRVQALSATEPACVKSVTIQKIMNEIANVLIEKKKMNILNFEENVETLEKVN